MLTRDQFHILTYLQMNTLDNYNDLSDTLNISVSNLEFVLAQCKAEGWITDEYVITSKGLDALEPYRVKRAVFLAAGFGSRLVPITINTPKPLVRVNGVRMIDTLLDAVIAAGIEEIYIVRGYLGEQFDQLLYKYPMIQFIDNPEFDTANNISSAFYVRHLLQNAYVMEADLVLYNPSLITKYQYTSNYLGVPVEQTDDWCFEVTDGVISKLGIGGINCYHEYGISYWNAADGAKLCDDIKTVYGQPGGKEYYWDLVPLEHYLENYKLEVRECTFADIIEIDSYADLQKIDDKYC